MLDLRLLLMFLHSEVDDLYKEARLLTCELKQVDKVESASYVFDTISPDSIKAIMWFLVGLLTAEVSVASIKHCTFWGEHLGEEPIEFFGS